MCVVSMIGDHYKDIFAPKFPGIPEPLRPWNPDINDPTKINLPPPITREEFESLKKEVESMKELLKRAKAYDEATGQKDCEMDEKVKFLRRVAKEVGVDLDEVFGKPKTKTIYYIAYQDGPADNRVFDTFHEAYAALMKDHDPRMPLDRYVAMRDVEA